MYNRLHLATYAKKYYVWQSQVENMIIPITFCYFAVITLSIKNEENSKLDFCNSYQSAKSVPSWGLKHLTI